MQIVQNLEQLNVFSSYGSWFNCWPRKSEAVTVDNLWIRNVEVGSCELSMRYNIVFVLPRVSNFPYRGHSNKSRGAKHALLTTFHNRGARNGTAKWKAHSAASCTLAVQLTEGCVTELVIGHRNPVSCQRTECKPSHQLFVVSDPL